MQNKDVIYIDVEDDITAIIGKVKDAKQKIVALVPPKRTGVLQSAVNLRLLARTAEGADKRLVLITGNAALSSLAASAEIPVAKNLHSRPELATVASKHDEDEDIIDGENLPIGDHAKKSDDGADELPADSIKGLDIDGEATAMPTARQAKAEPKERAKRGIKVPDFGSFRKRLAFGVGGGVLLILFLVWALVIAPHATVVVTAKTSGQFLTTPVTLGSELSSDPEKATIKSIKQTEKISQSVDFEATGTKDVGEKATGTVQFTSSFELAVQGATIPSGTRLKASGMEFVTTQNATFAPVLGGNKRSVGIMAVGSGTQYNDISGSMSGAPSGVESAQITGATSGGTSKIVKVVSQEDIDNAKSDLEDAKSDDAKKKLKAKFKKTDIILDSSFTTKGGDPVSSPAVGQEATDGKAKLTSEVTYTMLAVAKDEMDAYLDEVFEGLLTSKDSQRVYDNGLKDVAFDDFVAGDKDDTATLTTTAQVGPKINDENIKEQVKGKRVGEIIGDIKATDGVSDVEVKLSPFWVTGVPDDVKKISVEFKLKNNE